MNKYILILGLSLSFVYACKTVNYGGKTKGEDVDMFVKQESDPIGMAALGGQDIPNLASRGGKGRGPLTPLVGQAVSIGAEMVKQMIELDKKKHTASFNNGLSGLYFYDQLSNQNHFDPIGMQFKGFEVLRTFDNKGKTDTAFYAYFELDTTNPYEIINNAFFRLRLRELKMNYAKAKLNYSKWYTPWTWFNKKHDNRIHMDIEIAFNASFVNKEGQLFDNITLGTFYLNLRDIPLDKNAEGYQKYYDDLKGTPLDGRSFIVPRSFGYRVQNGLLTPCYSQGMYNITVNINESSKDKFVTKLVVDNSSQIIDALRDKVLEQVD